MKKGTVKWFSKSRGFGFITQHDGTDVFAHHLSIAGHGFKTLSDGDSVSFDVIDSNSGPIASNIVRL